MFFLYCADSEKTQSAVTATDYSLLGPTNVHMFILISIHRRKTVTLSWSNTMESQVLSANHKCP